VPAALAAGIPAGAIETGAELVALRRRPSGACVCTFARRGGSHFEATADRVVLALPFTMLRRVDLSGAGLSARKLDAIHHLPMGTNAKLHVQFGDRYWYRGGCDGTTYADTGYESCWEATTAEPGRQGVLVQYTGGRLGRFPGMPAHGPAAPALVHRFLRQLEPVIPGGAAHWNGRAWLDHWTAHPWTHGSYSYWGPGHLHPLRRVRGRARGYDPLRRRAHVAQLPGLHGGRCPQRPPRGPRDRLKRRTPGWTRAPRVLPGSFGTEEGGVLSRRVTASSIRAGAAIRKPGDPGAGVAA
jgi:Flavin containing amine oxidoreductase